jgi:hypothetical protein
MRHSECIQGMCNDMELIEPFRFKFLDKKEFPFVPRSALSRNRSRINFF